MGFELLRRERAFAVLQEEDFYHKLQHLKPHAAAKVAQTLEGFFQATGQSYKSHATTPTRYFDSDESDVLRCFVDYVMIDAAKQGLYRYDKSLKDLSVPNEARNIQRVFEWAAKSKPYFLLPKRHIKLAHGFAKKLEVSFKENSYVISPN